jgi:hypothetical protein
MEAVRTSETSVDNHSTRQYNPEDSSEHHTRRRENLKSHNFTLLKQQRCYDEQRGSTQPGYQTTIWGQFSITLALLDIVLVSILLCHVTTSN